MTIRLRRRKAYATIRLIDIKSTQSEIWRYHGNAPGTNHAHIVNVVTFSAFRWSRCGCFRCQFGLGPSRCSSKFVDSL